MSWSGWPRSRSRAAIPTDTRVFHEGDPGDACYIVNRGSCRVIRQHSDGRVITLATLGPGAIFGELAMLDGERRSASVEAAENTELLALPATDMRALIREHPGMAEKLIVALTRRLREANERIARQSFQTVPSRVAGVLNQLLAEEAATPLVRDGVTIRLRQSDLAQMAGTSRESVSRFLATLERAGVVQVGRGRVTVIEPSASTATSSEWPLRPLRPEFAEQRSRMVERQLRRRGIDDERVLAAMAAVPREHFVPDQVRDSAYNDSALPIGHEQTISQPWVVAAICQALRLDGDENVLEIGTGSGYSAAVLARLARSVISVERVPELGEAARRKLEELGIDNVEVIIGDGSRGYPEEAPYDAHRRPRGHPRGPAQPARRARARMAAWSSRSPPARPICSPRSSARTATCARRPSARAGSSP